MIEDIYEELITSGSWLYDGSEEQEVHIIKSNFRAGSGDHEDEPSVRDDQFGVFYGVRIGKYSPYDSYQGGAYNSEKEAKAYISEVCPSVKWCCHD